LEKHTKKTMPSRTTLTRAVEIESKLIIGKIKEKLKNKFLFVPTHEITDGQGRPF